ncbi:FMN-binding negative transcriptional regulator [Amycolatopsis sp. PS_44_ISF1]|uniref:FMN-binding negative transcriptional regulator n=1 Tax=Amycolatopsis sp. PS_44_ISF1 TaxID=2974917 RepID=UPI0028DDD58D|nr:FMN-binding negative transcriptional regulator [Amycolatopsis sp. PS_44_ISF1]MDT8914684.1 FMN-binding negative transcriptional regulator [Amycolatopsis sp. PS_44_ISF1]
MFVPEIYRAPDPAWLIELVRAHPLAILVTPGPAGPLATHLPIVFAADVDGTEPPGTLAGATLYGHLNRANPHWPALAGGADALVVFHGPHGYVSPAVYGTTPASPTWDFTAVHVRGALRPLTGSAHTMRIVRATARVLEDRFGAGWDQTSSRGYFGTLLPGVGAFEVAVTTADGMFKLSQEQEPEVCDRVVESFAGSDHGLHRRLAALIARAARARIGVGRR